MENNMELDWMSNWRPKRTLQKKVLLMERRFFADMTKNHRRTIIAGRLMVIMLIELLEEIKLMASVS